ncbi:MATE family efflux transporter [Lujinxingia sediminis]|uniref:Multidrug-efflux transporter n=1 Tax=Lujinxingia sediminis TaxID=2480984 RepID=A0ABY0CXV3_9DELT|nr:MATE family efflux transporter [Lujinxingia sediminis]RVU48454.1 MATE family efflux transporter [Lujinxingia sediminis]
MARASTVDTTEGSLAGRSAQLAWPAVLQAILANFYAFNDFVFVGMLGDAAATAALSACFALLILHFTFIKVFPVGATALIAQAFGARKPERIGALFRSAVTTTMGLSLLIAVAGVLAMPWFVSLANVTPEVGLHVADYLRIIYWATPTFALMLVVVGVFRACGDTRTPLVLEIGSLLVNIVLNFILVLGWGPIPAMGIEGAALATALSRGLPGIVGLGMILRGDLDFDPMAGVRGRLAWRPDLNLSRQMAAIGIFEALSGLIYGGVYLMLNRMAGELGSAAQGGLGAGLRGIEWIGFAFGSGFLTASISIVGQNVGAGKMDRAWGGAWISAGLSALCCQLVGLIFILFPESLSRMVTDDLDTLRYAMIYVYYIGWVMWAVGFEMSMFGAMVGAGQSRTALAVSGGYNLVRIPLAAGLLFGLDNLIDGVRWVTLGAADAPDVVGPFAALVWTIGLTSVLKAITYALILSARWRALKRSQTTPRVRGARSVRM